jgi:chromosome segregation ATPase
MFLLSSSFQVDRLTRESKFRGPILGPIGSYLKIASGKEQFATIAELALGPGILDRFIVTNDQDRKTFQQIRKNMGCQQDCGIFQVEQSARYNIPAPHPVPGIETVASVLNISDDLVFNSLVDTCRIDNRALAKSREESERLLLVQDKNNGGYSVRGKLKAVYCLPTGDHWTVKDGSIAIVGNEKPLKGTIGIDRSAALAEARRESQELQNELKEFRQEEAKIKHEHTEHQKEWNVKKRASQTNDKEMEKYLAKIESLKAEKDSVANFDTDTSEYENDMTEAHHRVQELKDRESSLKEEMEEKAPEVRALKKQLKEVKIRNETVLEDMKMAEDELNMYIQNMSQQAEKIEKKREKIRQLQTILAKQEAKAQEIAVEANRKLRRARTMAFKRTQKKQRKRDGLDNSQESEPSRVPTEEELEWFGIQEVDNDPRYYEPRIALQQAIIEKERTRRGVANELPATVYQRYVRAKKTLEGKLTQISNIEQHLDLLFQDLKARQSRWCGFRDLIARNASIKFDEIFNMMGASGELVFNTKLETLELIVQKDSADANSQQMDVNALSGGERSYATIALLMALGESVETPFRVMDEFDVFLDTVTLKLTIDILIKMAKEMGHRQFIFITPQDVSNLTPDPQLKILKMTPPERMELAGAATQQTLDFSQGSN